ncbi:hypothetical protein FGIG_03893 [Fasciola gigantica]|uniref:SAM domain-containing protein n=1 Tax=Fasciola gigantica TaxID=46835 RepID=A0A504YY34_FASGI|nr:hypothetical protein FGIG_03893 [Fasciola gigantica]
MYRGFLTARGPQPVGLVPGWAISSVPGAKLSPLVTPVLTKAKVNSAVQTDFPDDLGDEFFSDTDESGSSEAEQSSFTQRGTMRPIEMVPCTTPRTNLMSSSVELKPRINSKPGSPNPANTKILPAATMMPTNTASTNVGTTTVSTMSKLHKFTNGNLDPDSTGSRVSHQSGNVAAQTMTPVWENQKRHSVASLDSGRDSTYAGSSEESATQSTHPPSGAMLRLPQTSFDRAPLTLNTSGTLDPQAVHTHATMMHCSFPGSTFARTRVPMIASRNVSGTVASSIMAEPIAGYAQNEGILSLSSTDSLSEGSPRYAFPYNCNSLPSSTATDQAAIQMPSTTHHRPTGIIPGRAPITDNSYFQFVPPYTGIAPVEYRPTQPLTFHSPHSAGHARHLAYRPVVDYFERRPEFFHDPLAQWLHSIGLSRLEETLSSAGFDLWTLCRTTPEELNACGVTNPADRQLLRMELNRLQLPNTIPDTLPCPLLTVFFSSLRLGHQKKLILAIGRLTRQIAASKHDPNRPVASSMATSGLDNAGGFSTHANNTTDYSSSHGSSASISSPSRSHQTGSLNSTIPSGPITPDTCNPTMCLFITPSLPLEELTESENLDESPTFLSPPPAFQDPDPLPKQDKEPQPQQINPARIPNSSLFDSLVSGSTGTNSAGANQRPPVPLRRSSMTDEASDLSDSCITANQIPTSSQSIWIEQNHKSLLHVRLSRLAHRARSIVSSNTQDDDGAIEENINENKHTQLTRRSSSPSLFPPKLDSTGAKEQLTKWSSGQLATPQLCFPSNSEALLDPELQDMSDIRAMLDALSEHLTSATQL